MLGGFANGRIMTRQGRLQIGDEVVSVDSALLDTGASSGNYVGGSLADRLVGAVRESCHHPVKLGDGKTKVILTECITAAVRMYDDQGKLTEPIETEFYVMPDLGDSIIIGLPDILGNFYDIFTTILENARQRQPAVRVERLYQLYNKCKDELCSPEPSRKKLKAYGNEARAIGSWYSRHKTRIKQDRKHTQTEHVSRDGTIYSILHSAKFGTAYAGDSIETLAEIVQELKDFPIGEILDAWSQPFEECPEERDTPDPYSIDEALLNFMEMPVEESRAEYLELLETHVSPELRAAVPRVMDILKSPAAMECFAPSSWKGLQVNPVKFDLIPGMPNSVQVKPRPIRPDLYEHAKKEFDRMAKYFYETDREKCTSSIASPLVIAPKATSPFIRFCGDYRVVNDFISIPKHPIPVVQHELAKASQFKVFLDLDMANSFHQIPLSEEASQLLSVQTPWGLVRPKFLPEGVGPASGLLQSIVKEIFDFEDFASWTIVIFDNFLVLANDYEDAANKLERVIARCAEFGVVLKIKKSFIGVETVTFFGYEVSHGKWKLSESRKQAIEALPFPQSKKEMQSFLGASLFFHNHIADYSEWSAKLYETTHDNFSWDRSTWQFDYESYFIKFKECIKRACELYFPRYELPWVVRCDASEHAVGAVLFQILTLEDGTVQHQPIAFSSKRFSEPATKWDAYKREAFAIYHSVHSFGWYLRGKDFIVETDHRNLQWIESSLSPIVCRWRALLQSYQFKIRHIPGRDNKVADWMSRPSPLSAVISDEPISALLSRIRRTVADFGRPADFGEGERIQSPVTPETSLPERTLESMLREVHGGRRLHWGASRTWLLAKQQFPGARISLRAVQEFVRECPLCQKTRDTGVKGLAPKTLTLKPEHYRKTIGMDHVTVTPADRHGNKAALLLVEHFSHYPHIYPVKDYSAETVAITLFKHYTNVGVFDQIASDPGSAFTSEVVDQLNRWFGVRHKVSLVGRHESNGCEGTIKQFLRHLKTLVMDERHYDNWSDDTVLPWIQYELATNPTEETGGFTPYELKYGTFDASYHRLPSMLNLKPGERAHQLIKQLDENLKHIRELSRKFQLQLAEERRSKDKGISQYEKDDLVLLNAREKPSDHLDTKLSPDWLGPFEVIKQEKNDVTIRHVVLRSVRVVHVTRLKPFFGSYDEAVAVARHDQHQYFIISINYFTGNPHVRTSMTFNVTFEDGTITMPYGVDLAQSQQFEQYILAHPILFPLRFTAKVANQKISNINSLVITEFQPGSDAFLDLRFYDGRSSTWFDSLDLPKSALHLPNSGNLTYVTPITFTRWVNRKHTEIEAMVHFWGVDSLIRLQQYDIQACVYPQHLPSSQIIVDQNSREQFKHLLQS